MMRRFIGSIAGLVLLANPAARAQTAPDPAAMAAREVALLEFYGGGSRLTPAERQQAAAIVENGMRADPRAEMADDAAATRMLAVLAKADARQIAQIRATGRQNAAFHQARNPAMRPQQEAESAIIAAHDPAIVSDVAHQRLISEQTLKILLQGNAEGARLFDVPPPGPGTGEALRSIIRTQYASLDAPMQDALAHAEQTLPYAAAYLQHAQPQKRAAFIASYRQQILAGPTPADQQFRLAEVMAKTGQAGMRRTGAPAGRGGAMLAGRLQSQMLLQNQLMGAARSFSPSCNVATGAGMANFSYCHP